MAMIGLFMASSTFAAQESLGDEQPGGQYKKPSQESELLNLRIGEASKSTSRSDCDAERKMMNNRRQLDPQLPSADRTNPLAPVLSDACKDAEHPLPMSR